MPQLEEQVLEHLRTLPISKQQEVLDFVLFLNQQQSTIATDSSTRSFSTVAHRYAGCLDGGPSDLSTNPQYMKGFGEL